MKIATFLLWVGSLILSAMIGTHWGWLVFAAILCWGFFIANYIDDIYIKILGDWYYLLTGSNRKV